MEKQSKFLILGGSIVLIIAAGFTVWQVWPDGEKVSDNGEQVTEEKPRQAPSISGQLIDPQIAGRRPMAVMVENHPDSRPQSGISQAEVVYEMVAEGGITRYVAFFQRDVEAIGPVRSARDYFADIANSWGALYAHVGGSPEVLDLIKNGAYKNLTDINEFYQAEYFERIKARIAPHNTYTSTQKLLEYEALTAKNNTQTQVAGFVFSEIASAIMEPAGTIAIDFSLPSYKVGFAYDSSTKLYKRAIAGKADIDSETKTQIAPKTVIVELTDIAPIPGDDKFRVNIKTLGTGKAYIFQNGGVVTATWKREAGKPAQYIDVQNNAITFQPGQIWVAVVSKANTAAVTWKAEASK